MFSVRSSLRSFIWGQQHSRVRAIWRVFVPALAGFLALLLVGEAALTFGLNRGEMMVVAFGGTTLVMLDVICISARYLDHRPLREYGYRLSRDWWQSLVVGTGLGILVVAMTFVIARFTDSLRVTSGTLVPDAALLGWLLVYFAAFVGVAFYLLPTYAGVGTATPWSVVVGLMLGQYLLKLLIALVDTPFVYAVVGVVRSRADAAAKAAATTDRE